MSKLEVDKIDPQSGTDLELGTSGDTITIPTGVTLDASNATTTLPANVVTTDGSQTLTNKSIDASQLTGTITPSDNTVSTAKVVDGAITSAKIASGVIPGASNAFRNIIINGDMSIAQRGTSATGLGNGDTGYFTCDRWKLFESGAPAYEFTQTQDTDVPSGQGFATSLKMDCTTADASLDTADLLRIMQVFEGQNLQYLKYGTSNASSLTASFWVKSSVTGDYSTHLYASGATNRIITSTFTINSVDTWEKKTITFAGDTAQVISNDNQGRLLFTITLLAGTDYTSTDGTSWGTYSSGKIAYGQTANVASSTANNFWITGVQLEAGTTASDFEFLPYDVNLDRCERYYQIVEEGNEKVIANGAAYGGSNAYGVYNYRKQMRATPSLEQTTGTGYYRFRNVQSDEQVSSLTFAQISNKNCRVSAAGSMTTGDAGWFSLNNANSKISMDSEL